MIWLDDKSETVRVQSVSKYYIKLHDGRHSFNWFYDPAKFIGYICAGPTSLVEWEE